jgi:hypothetical protein
MNALVVEHDIEEGAMHMEAAIPAQPAFVIMAGPSQISISAVPQKSAPFNNFPTVSGCVS